MLFNSLVFALFFPIVFALYWLLSAKRLKAQNLLLLLASYFFYGWWDWRFLLLLVFLSFINYFIAIEIDNNNEAGRRKIWLISGLIANIGVLFVFKYFNFFVDGFIHLATVFGYNLPKSTIRIILPLGISFYVFLSLSYVLDVYKKNLCADKNCAQVLLTLSFFPIILAGPIQRPASLLAQISKKREFNYGTAIDGLKQMLWGLFTKMVIADQIAWFVDDIFSKYSELPGSTLALGAILYSVQIYADFSGYSNMAIGLAKLLGFNLIQNFNYPYFARDITEFWKRWHISLTTWFRDYVFLPISFTISYDLSREKVFTIKKDHFIYIIASAVTWLLTGLWHGADYTFIIWGLINGLMLIFYHLMKSPRKIFFKSRGMDNKNPIIVVTERIITLLFVTIAWVLFRSDSIRDAFLYLDGLFSGSLFTIPTVLPKYALMFISIFFVIEWFGRDQQYAIAVFGHKYSRIVRWGFFYFLLISILVFGGIQQNFIYFQF